MNAAETLRKAAAHIRADHGLNDTRTDAAMLAAAAWLESLTGSRLAAPKDREQALAFARAYLGGDA